MAGVFGLICALGTTRPVLAGFDPAQTVGTGASPTSLATADLNGNGKPDLAVANQGSNTVGVLTASQSGALQFAGGTFNVGEGAGTVSVTLSRTGSSDGVVSALVNPTGGSAIQGQDFSFPAPQTVTWADGDSADKTVSIPIIQDLVDEPDETVQLTLTLPPNRFGATVGAQASAILTIADNNAAPVVSIAGVSVLEGNSETSAAGFTVSVSGQTSQTMTVQYATADGLAQAGRDYTATSGTLTFAPNEASRTVIVPILGDAVSEPDETFTMHLSSPTNLTVGISQAIGIIQKDDTAGPEPCTPRPRVTQAVVAGGGALRVRVESIPLKTSRNNALSQIKLGSVQNATVTVNGQPVSSGQTVSLPPNTVGAELIVRRVAADQPATVPFTVVDGCGEWQTFVGGGVEAGF